MKPVLLDNRTKYEGPWVPVKNGEIDRKIEAEGFQPGDIVQLHITGGVDRRTGDLIGERFLMAVSEDGTYPVVFKADYIRGSRIQSTGGPVSVWVH